ncbi:unnamed protein product, partial [marine sediment metagenome]
MIEDTTRLHPAATDSPTPASMTAQFGAGRDTFFCGGGAQSPALKKALEKATGRTIEVLPDPQFVV